MPIVIRNLARVELQDEHKLDVLKMYSHEKRKLREDDEAEVLCNYVYRNDVAYLPLNATKLKLVSILTGQELVDERSEGLLLKEPFVLNPGFKFREHQVAPAPKLLAFTQNHQYSILKAPCSSGKTVVMTWVAGQLGKRVLVLVDQGNLADQWQEAFKIVWNKDATILRKEEDLDADVLICTFQLLHKHKDWLPRIKDAFGTCLLDEFHGDAAKTYRMIIFGLNNFYRIGTTATLMRKGFSDEVLTDLVADVSVEMVDQKALVPEIEFVPTNVSWCSNDPDQFTKILTELSQNDARNAIILDLIRKQVDLGRKILFIGARTDSLKYLHQKASEFCSAVLYVGSTTQKQDLALKEGIASGATQVIFADKKVEKGVDLPALDVLILAKPVNNEATVTQLVGRIVRALEGKPTPKVYDLYDRGNLAWRFAGNRLRWYQQLGYKIIGKPNFSLDTP